MAIVTNFSTSSSIKSALDYGGNPSKIGASISMNCSSSDAVRDFSMPFQVYGKEKDKVKLHRFVLSFANGSDGKSELNNFDSQTYVRNFIDELDKQLGFSFPIIAFQHLNTSHVHYHFYIGACGTDGDKFHPKSSPLYICRHINDSLSQKYHLKPIREYRRGYRKQYSYEDKQEFQHKHGSIPYSYKSHARQVISRAILSSDTLDDFKNSMIDQGGGVDRSFYRDDTKTGCVFIPFMHKDRDLKAGDPNFRKVRTRSLGKDFEKDKIKAAISSKDKKLLSRYRYYAKDSKTVQGGKQNFPAILTPSMTMDHTATENMREVPYKDATENNLSQLKKYKNNGFLDTGISMAILKGLTKEEREAVLNGYKLGDSIFSFLSSFFSDTGSIFSGLKKSFKDGKRLTYTRLHSIDENMQGNQESASYGPFSQFRGMRRRDVINHISRKVKNDYPDAQPMYKRQRVNQNYKYNKNKINRRLKGQSEQENNYQIHRRKGPKL